MSKPRIVGWTSTFGSYRKEADILGPHIATVLERTEEDLDHPAVIVDDAKNPRSPLHKHFEWNDAAAASKHRLWEARRMLNCIRVVIDKGNGRETVTVPAFVNIVVEEFDPDDAEHARPTARSQGYATVKKGMITPSFRKYLLGEALRAGETFMAKYALFEDDELADVFQAIKMTIERNR